MFASLLRISLAMLVVYAVFGSGNAIAENPADKPVANNTAPNFLLDGKKYRPQQKTTTQQTISLADYRGNLVYVDFWASWCQPCRKSFTWMNRMQALYGAQGLEIIAINLDEDRKKAEQFLRKIPANFDVAFDPRGRTAEDYEVQAMPSSYLIDKHGRLVHVNKGFRGDDEQELEALIRQHIRQSTVAHNDR